MQLAGQTLDDEVQLCADMMWAYAHIQRKQAVFMAEQQVRSFLLMMRFCVYDIVCSWQDRLWVKMCSYMLT